MLAKVQKFIKLKRKKPSGRAFNIWMHMLGAAPAALKVNIMVFESFFPNSNILIAFY